jgi:5-methylcytosine-specific restriction enzyme A
MPLPSVDAEEISAALDRFDHELRNDPQWVNWQNNQAHRYAISKDDKLYPVKQIIAMATGKSVDSFSGGSEANSYVKSGASTLSRFVCPQKARPGSRCMNCFSSEHRNL